MSEDQAVMVAPAAVRDAWAARALVPRRPPETTPDGLRASGAPGLAPNHQTSPRPEGSEVDEEPAGDGCPARRGMVWLNMETGESRPARCARNGCSYCLTMNARRRALAIAYAGPERELRLSLVADEGDPNPWVTARYRVNKMREFLKKWGEDPGLWGWHVEPNPAENGFHAHVVQHGRKVNKDALDQASFRAGAGLTRVRKVRQVDGLAEYGLKGAALAAYGLKGAAEGTDYLRLNGGRLGHYSAGFFRSPDGTGTLPVRVAERRAMAARYGETEPGTWTLATERGAASWASRVLAAGRASGTRAPGLSPGG